MPSSALRRIPGFRTFADDVRTRDLLRALLRETAQSVAVVTTRLPAPAPSTEPAYHGATLSSFTSVALDPFPLVAFSLRVPSRMATALNTHAAAAPSPPPQPPSSGGPATARLVVNILSAAQPDLAERFARPDRFPRPFEDLRAWSLSQEGIPVLSGALGALSCALVGRSLPLAHLCGPHPPAGRGDANEGREEEVRQASGGRAELASELFIARVLRVECVSTGEQDGAGLNKMPLVYHRRRYTTVENSDHGTS